MYTCIVLCEKGTYASICQKISTQVSLHELRRLNCVEQILQLFLYQMGKKTTELLNSTCRLQIIVILMR